MANKVETLYVIDGREPVLLSWARDAGTFGALIGTSWALNALIEPSGWLNAALAFAWVGWTIGRSARHRIAITPEQARDKIDAMLAARGGA